MKLFDGAPMITSCVRILFALVFSITRNRRHLVLVISLVAPIVLIAMLSSIPSLSSYRSLILQSHGLDRDTITISNVNTGDCMKITMGEGSFQDLDHVVVISINDFRGLLNKYGEHLNINSLNCSENRDIEISFPRRLIIKTDGECIVRLNVDNEVVEGVILYAHDYIDAVIVNKNIVNGSTAYLCLASSSSYVDDFLHVIDDNIGSFIDKVIIMMVIMYSPLLYVALIKTVSSIENELRSLERLGVNKRPLILYVSMALIVVSSMVMIALYFLSMISVFTVYYVLSLFTTSLPPSVNLYDIARRLVALYPVIFVLSTIASWRIIYDNR